MRDQKVVTSGRADDGPEELAQIEPRPAASVHDCSDTAPTTVVELIYRLLSNTGHTIRVVIVIAALALLIEASRLPAGQLFEDVGRHYAIYLTGGGFVGGSLVTRGVAKKKLKKRNGQSSDE